MTSDEVMSTCDPPSHGSTILSSLDILYALTNCSLHVSSLHGKYIVQSSFLSRLDNDILYCGAVLYNSNT